MKLRKETTVIKTEIVRGDCFRITLFNFSERFPKVPRTASVNPGWLKAHPHLRPAPSLTGHVKGEEKLAFSSLCQLQVRARGEGSKGSCESRGKSRLIYISLVWARFSPTFSHPQPPSTPSPLPAQAPPRPRPNSLSGRLPVPSRASPTCHLSDTHPEHRRVTRSGTGPSRECPELHAALASTPAAGLPAGLEPATPTRALGPPPRPAVPIWGSRSLT